jgi:hypothetical protein
MDGQKHHVQVTEADWEAATKVCSPKPSPSGTLQHTITNHSTNKKPRENMLLMLRGVFVMA